MPKLIITTDDSLAGLLLQSRRDLVVPIDRRLVWGAPPSAAERTAFVGSWDGLAESPWLAAANMVRFAGLEQGALFDIGARCDGIDLWSDRLPNAQLITVWLLDGLASLADPPAAIRLVQSPASFVGVDCDLLQALDSTAVPLTRDHLDLASRAWQTWCAPSPQAVLDLVRGGQGGMAALPVLRQALLDLLAELPRPEQGVGATELRLLQLVAEAPRRPAELFPGDGQPNAIRTYDYWEIGELLDGLARAPQPAIAGLQEGPFTLDMHGDRERFARYRDSILTLTPLGEAVLGGRDDFARHNPVRRHWGGTELTSAALWRFDPDSMTLIPPRGP